MNRSDTHSQVASLRRQLSAALAAGNRDRILELGRQLAAIGSQHLKKCLDDLGSAIDPPTNLDFEEWLEDDTEELPVSTCPDLEDLWKALLDSREEWSEELLEAASADAEVTYLDGAWRVVGSTGKVALSAPWQFRRGEVQYALSGEAPDIALGAPAFESTPKACLEIAFPNRKIVVVLTAQVDQVSPALSAMWRLEFRLRETIFEKIWVGLGDAQKQQTGWRQLSADTDCDFLVAPDELPSHIHFRSPEKGTSETLRAELPLRRPGASGGGRRHTR